MTKEKNIQRDFFSPTLVFALPHCKMPLTALGSFIYTS